MILVTGGTGFLGRELVRQLVKHGEKVRVLTRKKVTLPYVESVYGDITNPDSLDDAMKGVDIVYHLAALVNHFAPESLLELVNVQGSRNVIRAAIKNKVKRVIYCSSVSSERGGGSTVYGKSKIKAEKEVLKYANKIPIIVIRPGPMYDRERKMLRWPVKIAKYFHIFGFFVPDITIHIASRNNVVKAMLLAKKRGIPGHIYTVCDAEPVKRTLLSSIICKKARALPIPIPYHLIYPFLYVSALFSETLKKIFKIRPFLTRGYIRVLMRERRYDISLAKKELGYKPNSTKKDFADAVESILRS
jgi:dihydroflavonol-4-reductase